MLNSVDSRPHCAVFRALLSKGDYRFPDNDLIITHLAGEYGFDNDQPGSNKSFVKVAGADKQDQYMST
jgi:hypothetical protein